MNQRSLKTNFIINVIGTGLPFAVALVTLPLYIAHIGTARYGVLAIVWILLGYFGFIDLGLSRASANALAKRAGASREERISILLTSLYLNLFLGIAGGVILYLFGYFLMSQMLTLNAPLAAELRASFHWIAGMLPLLMVIGVCRGAIESKEQFLTVNFIDVAGYVLGQVLPLVAAILIEPTLPVVLAAAFFARTTTVLTSLSFVIVAERIDRLLIFDREKLRELIGFGAWASVSGMISPILQFLDQILVGSIQGVSAVAHYAVPMNLVVRSQIVAGALSRATFPRFSRLTREDAVALGEGSAVTLGFLYGAMCASAIVLSKSFMNVWIGSEFASEATPILELLLVGAWINGIAFIPYGLLQGQGRPDVVAKLHALQIIPYVLLLWIMLDAFGVFGAAIAWTVRVAIDAIFLFKFAGFRTRNIIGLGVAFVLVLGSYAVTIQLGTVSILWSISIATFIFLTFVVFAVVIDKNSKRVARKFW